MASLYILHQILCGSISNFDNQASLFHSRQNKSTCINYSCNNNFFGSTLKKWLHILQVYWVLCSALKYYHLFLSENQWNNRRRVNLELHRRSPIYIQSLFLLSKEMCVTSLTIKKQQKENLIKNKITQSENRFTWPKFCNSQILSYTTTNPHWQAWRKRDREMLQRLHQWNCHV